jgi:uncharacterized protein (DUF433 family)
MSPMIQHTPGVCGGEACVGATRIAVWMLELARRSGVGEIELLKDCPGLSGFDLEAAWQYVEDHEQEISEAIRRNETPCPSMFDGPDCERATRPPQILSSGQQAADWQEALGAY